jgi:hypothetical protein
MQVSDVRRLLKKLFGITSLCNQKRYIDGFAGVNFPSSHGTGSSARPLGSTGSTEVVRLPYTLEPITQEISLWTQN